MDSNIFHFHPYLRKWSNLRKIFQMGWNHQQGLSIGWCRISAIFTILAESYGGESWCFEYFLLQNWCCWKSKNEMQCVAIWSQIGVCVCFLESMTCNLGWFPILPVVLLFLRHFSTTFPPGSWPGSWPRPRSASGGILRFTSPGNPCGNGGFTHKAALWI